MFNNKEKIYAMSTSMETKPSKIYIKSHHENSQKLGEKLSEEEEKFLSLNISNNMKQFELASDSTKIGIFHIF